MKVGIQFEAIKVSGLFIVDGHHRFVAAQLAGMHLDTVPTLATSATTHPSWQSVEIVADDWDTPAKILFLNQLDARLNGISTDQLLEWLT